jgi:hypothetical protein
VVVVVIVVVVVVLSPLPNSKANISQCTITCGVEKIGHEWHLFHYWVSFPFNAMNYLSIVEALFIDDHQRTFHIPPFHKLYDCKQLSYLRRNKEHEWCVITTLSVSTMRSLQTCLYVAN